MITIGNKEVELIDAHCHVWNKMHGFRFKDVPMVAIGNGRVSVGEKIIQFMAPSFVDCTSPLSSLETEMENNHVDKGVILQTPAYGEQYAFIDDIIKSRPGKFVTTGLADPYDKETFVKQADEAFDKWNCKGLKFEMPDTPFVPDAPENAYIFEYILEKGKYCMVDLGWGQGEFDYPIEAYKNVVKKYKELTFIFPHLGVSRLWDRNEYPNFDALKNTLTMMELNDNVWFDTAGLPMLTGNFEDYPYPTSNAALKVVKETVGMRHIMFGTDYPGSTPYSTYRQSIDQLRLHCDFLTDEDKIQLFSSNAQKLWFD